MKLKTYLNRINEKVTVSEIGDILKSSNVMVGAEFEFKINEFINLRKKFDRDEVGIDMDDEDEFWNFTKEFLKKSNVPVKYGVECVFKKERLKILNTGEWCFSGDASLDGEGLELISPPIPLNEFIKIAPKIFDWINKVGFTDNECGFHTHMSLKNVQNLEQELDYIKLMLFQDENYIWKYFKSREANTYVMSLRDILINKNYLDIDNLEKIFYVKKMENKFESEHYHAINFEHLTSDNKRIEFRHIGGKNYSKKWSIIQNIIATFAFNLSLSCDKDFKLKEYSKKLMRILNKIELKYIEEELAIIEPIINRVNNIIKNSEQNKKYHFNDIKFVKNLQKREKELTDEWRPLKNTYVVPKELVVNYDEKKKLLKKIINNADKKVSKEVLEEIEEMEAEFYGLGRIKQ